MAAEGDPTPAQEDAIEQIGRLLTSGAEPAPPVLLQGITGSGKTRIYVEAVAQVLERGGKAIVLVPEIGLAAPAVARFRAMAEAEREALLAFLNSL